MNEAAKRIVPDGWHTVTTRIFVNDPKGLADFLKHVFNATGEYRTDRPTQITIGDSIIMLSDTEIRSATSAFLYVYVNDVDETYQRALEAEALSLEEPFDTPYGDRRCMVEDKWGNTWQIATFKG
jgi:uncharacterized glyoxalase superfamily protein PhnB